jgi:hypothetical protein
MIVAIQANRLDKRFGNWALAEEIASVQALPSRVRFDVLGHLKFPLAAQRLVLLPSRNQSPCQALHSIKAGRSITVAALGSVSVGVRNCSLRRRRCYRS